MHKTDHFAPSGFHYRCTPGSDAFRADSREKSALLPMWPHELSDVSLAGRRSRIAVLRRTLRAERQRGVAGHWTYDLARHWALLRWYRTEVAELEVISRGKPNIGLQCATVSDSSASPSATR